jgi:hypothetical protein
MKESTAACSANHEEAGTFHEFLDKEHSIWKTRGPFPANYVPLLIYSLNVPGQLGTAGPAVQAETVTGIGAACKWKGWKSFNVWRHVTGYWNERYLFKHRKRYIKAGTDNNFQLMYRWCRFNALNGPHVARVRYGPINKIRSRCAQRGNRRRVDASTVANNGVDS